MSRQSLRSAPLTAIARALATSAVLLALPLTAAAQSASGPVGAPRFSLPLDCDIGRTCFIQQYVDVDPSPAARDYACGTATYDGHSGTDFRLLSTRAAERGVAVLAAADGQVLRVRDGMADRLVRETGKAAVARNECGNGLVIDHGRGLQTQYCHLKRGTLAVRIGHPVKRGQKLGEVGYSGLADFAHVHFTVRLAGKVVDPFVGPDEKAACMASGVPSSETLWDKATVALLKYQPAQIIQMAFAAAPPKHAGLEYDHERFAPPSPKGKALVVFARLSNLAAGDRLRTTTTGPGNFGATNTSEPLSRNQATFTTFSGRALKTASWLPGTYRGTVEVLRGGRVIATATAETVLP